MFEDAAQAIGATYNGRALGGIGALGCFSFHDTKNVTSGEGGAIIFGDSKFLERGEILREKGTNRSQFLQGLVDKYTWVDIGSSYVLSDLNAAYLYPQLTQIDSITEKRQSICAQYSRELGSRLNTKDIRILGTPAHNTPNYHIFALQFPSTDLRNRFIGDMKAKGITCPFHYVALHTSPFGQSFYDGKTPERLPGCDRFSQQLVRLPLFYNMTNAELNYVISSVDAWLKTV